MVKGGAYGGIVFRSECADVKVKAALRIAASIAMTTLAATSLMWVFKNRLIWIYKWKSLSNTTQDFC